MGKLAQKADLTLPSQTEPQSIDRARHQNPLGWPVGQPNLLGGCDFGVALGDPFASSTCLADAIFGSRYVADPQPL